MLHLGSLSNWARQWGIFFFYFFALGAVGIVSVYAGTRLTNKVVRVATQPSQAAIRPLSRVERHLRERERLLARVPARQDNEVVAMVRPALHPAVMAAQLDSVETAAAPKNSLTTRTVASTIASCDTTNCRKAHTAVGQHAMRRADRVRVLAVVPKGKRGTLVAARPAKAQKLAKLALATQRKAGMTEAVAGAANPAATKIAAPLFDKIAAPPSGKIAAPLPGKLAAPLPGKLAAPLPGKLAAPLPGKMSLLAPAKMAERNSSQPSSISLQRPLPLADTPGEIVRVSLLGSG